MQQGAADNILTMFEYEKYAMITQVHLWLLTQEDRHKFI